MADGAAANARAKVQAGVAPLPFSIGMDFMAVVREMCEFGLTAGVAEKKNPGKGNGQFL